jgi:outer membrane protein OmpA-like peptidoglycan-associated protein
MNMMTKINLQHLKITAGIIAMLLLCTTYVSAQNTASADDARPKDMFELGVHGGSLFVSGEIDPEVNLGYGFHIRKAIDYMFSLRFDAMMGTAKGKGRDGDDFWTFENQWSSGSILALMSLNSVRLDRRRKKMDIYIMGGAGGNFYKVDVRTPGIGSPRFDTYDREITAHAVLGAGLTFRINNKFNVGIEHQAFGAFGQRGDQLDGVFLEGTSRVRSGFNDVMNYTNLRINFNIGNSSSKSEPLYWGNLSDGLASSIDDIKKRQETALADTDLDGVIDAIDQEPNTPANVPVDTKGRTLDSDKDGIADYKDLEPYYPPRAGEQVNEDGVVVNPIAGPNGGGGVTEERVKEMIDEALSGYGLSEPKNNVAEWFLPMIHFGSDSYRIKYSDYGTLASIARMLKSSPSIRLVITGFTDQTGPESYNEGLSYQRSAAIAEHLVNQHGIGRGRLVLQWKGQDEALVPSGASYMNRRVEFRLANENDYEMDPPAGLKKSGTDGY